MTTSFYITGGNCGLKFPDTNYRDDFWNRLSAIHQEGAERIGNRTIRFYPARMKEGFEWPITTGNGASTNQAQETTQKVRMQQHVQGAVPPAPVTPPPATVTTTNPFASVATNPTRPLPGLCPPPPIEMLAQQQPVTASPELAAANPLGVEGSAIAAAPEPTILKSKSMGEVKLYAVEEIKQLGSPLETEGGAVAEAAATAETISPEPSTVTFRGEGAATDRSDHEPQKPQAHHRSKIFLQWKKEHDEWQARQK